MAFEGILRLADFAPPVVGEKTASTVHVPDGAIVWFEQLSFCLLKWPESVPVMVMLFVKRVFVPVLVRVKDWARDELPGLIEPKSFAVGEPEITELPNNPDCPPRTGQT